MIRGDFNYTTIDYTNLTVESGEDSDAGLFSAKMLDVFLFLVQNVNEPTTVREGQKSSILDYVNSLHRWRESYPEL